MKLTDDEKKMMNGDFGKVKQKALELIVRFGQILDAESLCRVSWADLFCGAHHYLEIVPSKEFDDVFSIMSLCSPEKLVLDQMDSGCICFSGVEADCTEYPEQMIVSESQKAKNLTFLNRFVDSGVILSGNCIPYLTGFIPSMGEHFVSCESSAVLFMNSLWGACGNGDGIEASFCAAVCGRTPLWGNHIMANRKGTILVDITAEPESIHDWDLLGASLGDKLPPHSRPVLTGSFLRPNAIALKQFFASLACAAGTEICHIVGITPEAVTLDAAIENKDKAEKLTISREDMHQTLASLNPGERRKIDYISMGCPHYHIDEIRKIAGFLDGKTIAPDIRVDLWTAGSIKYTSDRCGYTQKIEQAGANLLTASCPSTRGYPQGIQTAAYDSAKQRMSAAQETKATLYYGSTQDCLNTALSGYWEGKS